MQKIRLAVPVMAALLVVAGTGCSSGSSNPRPSASDSPTASSTGSRTSSTTSTLPSETQPSSPSSSASTPADPRVAAAVSSYTNFINAVNVTYTNPPKKIGDPFPARGDFRTYSFDPAQGQLISYVLSLTEGGIEYRGTPPTSRVAVVSTDLVAKPYPTVTLTDCPTAPPSWNAYHRKTGKPTTDKPTKVSPPYLVTVQVIYYEKHWGVQKLTPNASRTCTAP